MDCQDWNNITFNTPSQNKKKEEVKKIHSNKVSNDPEKVRMEAPKQLGQLISQARNTKGKTQKNLAYELGVTHQILAKWESNKELPTNLQISQLERNLGVKLPRARKVAVKDI
jgi:ribosome-binding protein aMBF1 (putative translation factor)